MQNLIHALADDGVEMLAFHDCERVEKHDGGYTLYYTNGEKIEAEKIIIATGRGRRELRCGFLPLVRR